ncbi:hypothetical protein ABL78_7780 [Leptomonas seymouri]|uniref:Uncharacterized protein n=1 Tax=Leptomonas seymouri TaxID=5684 RepID=A0A0N1IHM5_LEPSE|nr:hypothetical protein ABL78_7780 [Leptomonas seymouri]|eukprot:KPI83200.1 hypothetical protein ABL78_7780 [Leptomonas seymouri]
MDSIVQPYRLEVAVKRVYGLSPLVAVTSSKISVEVHFLDFPSIVVHPQGFAVGDSVTYNVCHKADFRMTAEQAASVFPAVCQCNLSADTDTNLSKNTQWLCPCALFPSHGDGQLDALPQQPPRTYVNCVIRSPAGETLGYAEMSCAVFSLAPPRQLSPPPVAPSQQMPTWSHAPPPATAAAAAAVPASLLPPPATSPDTHKPNLESEQGKPYIVRVVVGESDRRRRGARLGRRDSEGDDERSREVAPAHGDASGGGRHSSPVRRVSANTASKESLLYVLQYDVAYQLQSLSETTAAVLLREHTVLTNTPLSSGGKGDGVNIEKLTKSIDRSVAQMVKLSNIVLQVANQLIDNSPAPPRTGASREVNGMAQQKRNPVNKLPIPADGSVGHYLQYDVLYQLQCLGTSLAYVTLAYRDTLETPLSAIPQQHAEFCLSLGDEVQKLTRLLNILIQSSVDGTLGLAAPASTATVAKDESKKESQPTHQDVVAAKAKPPVRALDIGEVKTSRSTTSNKNSAYSSSSSSSSISSFDSSLNRPMTPVSKPPAPAAVPVAVPAPNPVAPSLQQQLQPTSLAFATPLPIPHAVPAQQQISPPSYATVAATQLTTAAATPPATESTPQKSPNSFLSVRGATPFSWVNAMNQDQRSASTSQPPLSTSFTPRSSGISGVYGPTGIAFSAQPATSQLSVAPPRLSPPSPLTPPTAIPPPVVHSVPASASMAKTQLPPPPPPLAPAAIPIPVPTIR